MIWHILRYWISFFIPAFYKKLQIKNLRHVMVDGPVIIAMNHPNAFTDPILFTSLTHPLKLKYLARGDAFKPGFVTWFLESIGIVPIFRIQDGGKEGLKKNEDAYRRVNYLLSRNSKIIVFAEGLCIQERRLRPLKKGVARMVFGAYDSLKNDKLVVLPVGVNYSKADKFRSTVFYNVGDPILVKDFMEEYRKNPAKANNLFLQALEPRMKALITHINDPQNDQIVEQVEILQKRSFLLTAGSDPKNLEDDFDALTFLTEKVNTAAITQPEILNDLKEKSARYFSDLKKYNLRDWLFDPFQNKYCTLPVLMMRLLLIFAVLPVFLTGLVSNYLPFKGSDLLTRKIVRHKEFYSSFVIGIAMVLFLLNYLLWFFLLEQILPVRIWTPFVLLLFGLSAFFSLYYVPFARKTFGMARYLLQHKIRNGLAERRAELISLINKF